MSTPQLTLKPLQGHFAAEASGFDLTQPLSLDQVKQVNAAMNRYAVLVWRNQPMTQQEQLKFAGSFGPLDIGMKKVFQRPYERLEDERLIDISNVDGTGQVAKRDSPKNLSNFANQLWHSDSSFKDPRAAYSMLHAVILPSRGGDTEFCDLRYAYDTLADELKEECAALQTEHYVLHTRLMLGDEAYTDAQKKAIPPAVWPLVTTHPGSGRKVLFVGVHARQILGWPTAEARMFLMDLLEHATRRENVYTHKWQVGDTVMWDNRATLHRGRRYPLTDRRELRRTTVDDTPEAILIAA